MAIGASHQDILCLACGAYMPGAASALSVLQDACNSTGHFLPPVRERAWAKAQNRIKEITAGGRKSLAQGATSLAAQAAAQTAAQLSWLAALLRSVNALKKRMYAMYIRFLQKLSQSSARTRRRNRMVVRQTAIRILGGGGVGEETLLQKGPSPTKHFKKRASARAG
ncbi:MAG: hypothetical protein RBR41_13055 [Desulfovibrio sp.]|uniref:hypothetical protein n=1 Tax=Desulfovibrio sp. TaxID=885 RepID=UPI002A364DD1|nr:hypothetical protein [Desulfovibrio sp.]MDY0260580.1 hypothetical protein [Desulfovibrio sp.]